MIKLVVVVFVALSFALSLPAFARSHHKRHARPPAYSGSIYQGWIPPYQLPAGVGPNDIPFAPF